MQFALLHGDMAQWEYTIEGIGSLLEVTGFTLVRADRGKQSGKKRGGGLAVFVNSKWGNIYFDSPSVDTLQVISSMSTVYQLTFNNTVSTDK